MTTSAATSSDTFYDPARVDVHVPIHQYFTIEVVFPWREFLELDAATRDDGWTLVLHAEGSLRRQVY